MSEQAHPTEVVRWYTLARRFPQLIGRTPDGAKLWGGPYTITQAVGGGVVLFVGINTMGLWARWGFFANALVLLSVSFGVVIGLGRIPVGSRNPVAVVAGAFRATTAPSFGRIGGKPVRPRKPHQLHHRVAIARPRAVVLPTADISKPEQPQAHHDSSAGITTTDPPSPTAPAHGPPTSPARKPALTGVQSLLATQQLERSEQPR